jgi:dipeptidyl aminopeptidase/acylaminoacyl peptidase
MRTPALVLLLGSSVLCQAPESKTDERQKRDPTRLEIDQLLDWENVSDPRLSPDGKTIVYTRQWTDKVEDRLRAELWLMGVDGSRPRFLTVGSDARWSPDGSRIAYLADGEPKGAQIFVVWVDGRERSQITHSIEAPGNLQWSPDGRMLACTMQVPEKGGFKIEMPAAPKGAKWIEEPKVINRLRYRRDQSGYAPTGWRHLFVVDADGGTPRQVTSGDFDHGAPQWTSDGKELVFRRASRSSTRSRSPTVPCARSRSARATMARRSWWGTPSGSSARTTPPTPGRRHGCGRCRSPAAKRAAPPRTSIARCRASCAAAATTSCSRSRTKAASARRASSAAVQ